MLKEHLEREISKGTRSQEGTKASANRYRFNEIIHDIHSSGALRLKPKVDVAIDRLSSECRDKVKTFLQTKDANPTEVSPFADTPFGIRRIHLGEGPLHIEVTGDKFHKIPWVLTVIILEGVFGWSYKGVEEIVYVPTEKGPKRMKNAGLLYQDKKIVAVMYYPASDNHWKKILVKWLERRDRQILVEYGPAGGSDGRSRLGHRYFIDYAMFSPSWVKRRASEILTSRAGGFNEKYEPTLAETKRELMRSER